MLPVEVLLLLKLTIGTPQIKGQIYLQIDLQHKLL